MRSCHACRAQAQYEAAVKRIKELEQQQDQAVQQACNTHHALNLKEAQLLAAKQSVRKAVAEHMKSTPASEWQPHVRHHVWEGGGVLSPHVKPCVCAYICVTGLRFVASWNYTTATQD